MRHIVSVIFAMVLLAGFNARAEEGKAVFDELRCGVCHKVDRGMTNPPLKEIAQHYKDKADQLSKYLKGEAAPIVRPEKGDRMKRYIEKAKALKDEEFKALIEFILSHHE